MVVSEILMRDNISDPKDLSGVQRFLFLSPDFPACSLRLQEVLLGSFTLATGCYLTTELMYAGCHLELLLEGSQGCRVLARGNNRAAPAKPEQERGAASLSQRCRGVNK